MVIGSNEAKASTSCCPAPPPLPSRNPAPLPGNVSYCCHTPSTEPRLAHLCFMAHFCYSAPVVGADRTGPCDSSVNSGITGGSFLQVLLLTSSPILTFQRRCNCPSGVYAVSCGGGTVTAASSWYPYPRASLVWRFPPCYKCATDFFKYFFLNFQVVSFPCHLYIAYKSALLLPLLPAYPDICKNVEQHKTDWHHIQFLSPGITINIKLHRKNKI